MLTELWFFKQSVNKMIDSFESIRVSIDTFVILLNLSLLNLEISFAFGILLY
jgi:hypothetical protein